MVFLGPAGAEIEVRLVKPPFDAEESARVYFNEYETLGTPHPEKLSYESTRYIIPENTTYALEVTLKKGFDYGEWDGVYLHIHNKAKKSIIGQKDLPKPIDEIGPLLIGRKLMVDRVDNAPVNGILTNNALLTFRSLSIDETLSNETDVPGVAPPDLGDIVIRVYRCKKPSFKEYTNSTYMQQLQSYQGNLLSRATAVDEKSFSKYGITHVVGAEGGTSTHALQPPRRNGWVHSGDKSRYFYYLCRSKGFLENNSIAKCPVPIECQPWDTLKEHERQACFKTLQAYDKDRVLMQKISEAGPEEDTKVIQRQLLELGEVPNRWRGWGQLYKRERQALFENLQLRRSFWEKGEIPPEDRPEEPETKPSTAQLTSLSTIKEEPVEQATQTLPIPPPQLTIKEEPIEASLLPKAKISEPVIIILDDTPPRLAKRAAINISTATATTIKAEPVDLDSFHTLAPSTTPTGSEGGATKKAKFEPGVTDPSVTDDEELLKLKEEEEREMEELLAAQRVQELIRKRNERKAKIAALEAKNSATPGRGSRS